MSSAESKSPRLLVPGIAVGGYRSLRDLQPLGPLRKVTLVAGQNNSGKSNILRFARLLTSANLADLSWVENHNRPGHRFGFSSPTIPWTRRRLAGTATQATGSRGCSKC